MNKQTSRRKPWMDASKELLLDLTDAVMALPKYTYPKTSRLEQCRLVAHRGEHGGDPRVENTLGAFEAAARGGAWGIEFDVRWTKDDVAVIHHDSNLKRSCGEDVEISEIEFEPLRLRFPEIPTLDEVLEDFAGRLHLMIEIKRCRRAMSAARINGLARRLEKLRPKTDYHLMSLSTDLLLACEFSPRDACLPVAEFNVGRLSKIALREGFGGLTGQYVLMSEDTIRRHHEAGQKVGTGFAASEAVMRREIQRGVDWIFTNQATARAADLALLKR